MQAERIIMLGDDGVFTAIAKGAICRLMFDSEGGVANWLLVYTQDGSETDHILSKHQSLDSGLVALADQAGWDSGKFSVGLSSEDSFTRPGKVPAEEIMAAYGYMLAGNIRAYVVFDPPGEQSGIDAKDEISRRLAGRMVTLGSVDPIGEPDTGWCCDISIPYDGYIHQADVEAMVESVLADSDLEVVSVVEGTWYGSSAPNVAAVIHAFPEAA